MVKSTIVTGKALLTSTSSAMRGTCNSLIVLGSFSDGLSEFPHPSTRPGPHHLARLTRIQGMAALQESWHRCTGQPLPANVHAGVEHMIHEAGSTEG